MWRRFWGFYYRANPGLLNYNQIGVEAKGLFQPLMEATSGEGGTQDDGKDELGGEFNGVREQGRGKVDPSQR